MLYYSPEIITGQKYYGPEVDCWCLGITLFRMTAGFEPFSHAHSKFWTIFSCTFSYLLTKFLHQSNQL
jgi:serine/threonine protein kinase